MCPAARSVCIGMKPCVATEGRGGGVRLWMGLLGVAATLSAAELGDGRIKFIELGWDIPSTRLLRQEWRTMEQTTPFDGVIFHIETRDEQGRKLTTQAIWDARPWNRAWLHEALADLQACQFKRFTDNFVRINATPGNLDWADDAGWAALADKVGHCAWVMKQAGAKGLAFDFESYGAPQFQFDPSKGRSFADTARLARRRGAALVEAVAREFPEAVLLGLWLNSVNLRAGASDTPETVLAQSHYGLLPPFLDGMLDAAPPSMVLVDGCENGYYMDSAEEYLRAAHAIRAWNGPAMRLVSPANRPKYRQQVQVGFGFYLDMFLNSPTNRYYRGPLNGSRLARLERNLGFARDAADEYVWIYGEQCRWWGPPLRLPHTVGQGRLWEEAMPGITRAIAYVRDPVQAAQDDLSRMRAAGTLTNLARNADFSQPASTAPEALPAEFGVWQDERLAQGKFVWDPTVGGGAARASGVRRGCLIQAHAVEPGQTYAVQADCLDRGGTHPTLIVRWQTAQGRWTREAEDRTFTFKPTAAQATAGPALHEPRPLTPALSPASGGEGSGQAAQRPLRPLRPANRGPVGPATVETGEGKSVQLTDPRRDSAAATARSESGTGEWRRAFGVVTVPGEVGRLVILLHVANQQSDPDTCWFDNLALYRVR